jgi:hypothetical protein
LRITSCKRVLYWDAIFYSCIELWTFGRHGHIIR